MDALSGRKVLIVEDEAVIALDPGDAAARLAGDTVIGSVAAALHAVAAHGLDGAIVDRAAGRLLRSPSRSAHVTCPGEVLSKPRMGCSGTPICSGLSA